MLFRSAPTVHPLSLGPAPRQIWPQTGFLIRELLAEPTVKTALLIMIAIDMMLIAVHVLICAGQYLEIIANAQAVGLLEIFSVTRDRSAPEYFNHVKEVAMLAALLLIWMRSKRAIYIIWFAVMLLILGDDFLGIHEHIGHWVSTSYPVARHAEDGQAFGEMVAWFLYATVTIGLLWQGHRRSSDEERAYSWAILAGILSVSVFAVGVDAAHGMVAGAALPLDPRLVNGLLGLFEDGGEMLMLSLTCAIVLAVHHRQRREADGRPAV